MKSEPHDDYKNSIFRLEFEQENLDNNEILQFNSLQFVTNNDQFRNNVIEGNIDVYAHFECSNTLYRKMVKLSIEPTRFSISKKEISGKLYVSAFAIANKKMLDYFDDDFSSDYDEVHFDFDKYDILAFDDGFSIDVIHDVEKDDKISSIFVVVPKIDDISDGAEFSYDGNKIIIKLPQLTYNQYDRLKYLERYQNLFFSVFAIPVLAMSLNQLKKTNFDDLDIQYKWFISVKNSYKRVFGTDLTSDAFEELDSYLFAQRVFDNALIKSIDDLFNEGTSLSEELENEDD
jgi:hypothetical protein